MVMRKWETPVPIPNTTVKTHPADDTKARGFGKAGGCRAYPFKKVQGLNRVKRGSTAKAVREGKAFLLSTIKTEYR